MDKFDSFKITDLGKTDNFVSATGMANNGIDVLLESTSSLGHYVIENLSANGTLNSTTNLNTLLAATAHPLPGPSNNVNILGLKNGDVVVEYNNDDSNQTSFSMNAYFVVLDASRPHRDQTGAQPNRRDDLDDRRQLVQLGGCGSQSADEPHAGFRER
jgi:hypothetical protein